MARPKARSSMERALSFRASEHVRTMIAWSRQQQDPALGVAKPQASGLDRLRDAVVWLFVAACVLSICEFSGKDYGTAAQRQVYDNTFERIGAIKYPLLVLLAGIELVRGYTARSTPGPATLLYGLFWLSGTAVTLAELPANSCTDGLLLSGLYGMILLVALASRHDARRTCEVWSQAALAVCFAVIIGSLIYYFLGMGFFKNRLRGIVNHPNQLAAFAGMGFCGAYCSFLRRSSPWWILACLVAAGACLLSNSRTGMVGIGATFMALSVIFALGSGSPRHLVGPAVVGLIGLILTQWVFSNVEAREFELSNRADIWQRQWESIAQHPFLGQGFACETDCLRGGFRQAEGSPLTILSASGAVGFCALYGGLLLGMAGVAWSLVGSLRLRRALAWGGPVLAAMALFGFIISITESFFVRLGNLPFYIIAMGALLGPDAVEAEAVESVGERA